MCTRWFKLASCRFNVEYQTFLLAFSVLVMSIFIGGCDSTNEGLVGPDQVDVSQLQQDPSKRQPPAWAKWAQPGTSVPTTVAQQGLPTSDDYIAEIAERVPGFGGMFYDEGGQLTLYLTDINQKTLVTTALSDLATVASFTNPDVASELMADSRLAKTYAPSRFFSDPGLHQDVQAANVVQGQYDFRDLVAWRNTMRGLFAEGGVNLLDIDDLTNRIHIDMQDDAAILKAQERLAEWGIPIEAITFTTNAYRVINDDIRHEEEEKGTTPRAVTQIKLTDPFPVLQGGIKITGYRSTTGSSNGICSLGVVGWWGHYPFDTLIKGFITNSHCTEIFLEDDGLLFYQPRRIFSGELQLGLEWQDTQVQYSGGQSWAFGDFAFISIVGAIDMGRIAHPRTVNSVPPDLIIDDSQPVFHIRSDDYFPIVGHEMHSVGERSGWTKGTLQRACADIPDVENPPQVSVDLLCQNLDNRPTVPGDSGSPVFKIMSGSDVEIAGIHWGRVQSSTQGVLRASSYIGFARGSLTMNTYFHECDYQITDSC